MKKIIDVRTESNLYSAGRDEDGEEIYGESFKVVVEFEGGEAYCHEQAFPTVKLEAVWCDDINEMVLGNAINPEEQKAKAERLCARVLRHVEAGGKIDMDHWTFYRTVYGTQAYLDEVAAMTPEQRAQ
jgi:hypothetical protein